MAKSLNPSPLKSTAVNYAVGSYPYSIFSTDFNGDGKMDLATANNNSNNVSILLGSGTGTFAAAVNYGVGIYPSSVFSADFNGDGNMQRCHFIKDTIGNIYDSDFKEKLFPRLCTNDTCGCHIGYVHLEPLNLYDVYKDKVLERIAIY